MTWMNHGHWEQPKNQQTLRSSRTGVWRVSEYSWVLIRRVCLKMVIGCGYGCPGFVSPPSPRMAPVEQGVNPSLSYKPMGSHHQRSASASLQTGCRMHAYVAMETGACTLQSDMGERRLCAPVCVCVCMCVCTCVRVRVCACVRDYLSVWILTGWDRPTAAQHAALGIVGMLSEVLELHYWTWCPCDSASKHHITDITHFNRNTVSQINKQTTQQKTLINVLSVYLFKANTFST